MSELKARHIVDVYDSYYAENPFGERSQVYLKSEADKVIAEKDAVIAKLKAKLEGAKNETNYWCNNLKVFAQKKDAEIAELKADYKESCDRLHTANLIKDEQLAASRHHKYKRCLAMARWCESEENRLEAIAPIFDTNKECWEYNSDYWYKQRERWLKIAEQFKDKEA